MNTTVFSGDPRARVALKEYLLNTDNDWAVCAGGEECRPWKETAEGRQRYTELAELYKERTRHDQG